MQIWSGCSRCVAGECAADAAFRAEQLKVAIQDGCVKIKRRAASRGTINIKREGRCHLIKEKEAK
jgi:hypothetical protein